MTFDEYQTAAAETAVYKRNPQMTIMYPALGLAGETGEVLEKIKKFYRDAVIDREAVKKELGDVLWYVSALAGDLGFTLDDVAQTNINKLRDRKMRNQLHGSGDNR